MAACVHNWELATKHTSRQRVHCRVQLIVRFALKLNKNCSLNTHTEQKPTASKPNIARELLETDSSQNSGLLALGTLFPEAYLQRIRCTLLAVWTHWNHLTQTPWYCSFSILPDSALFCWNWNEADRQRTLHTLKLQQRWTKPTYNTGRIAAARL